MVGRRCSFFAGPLLIAFDNLMAHLLLSEDLHALPDGLFRPSQMNLNSPAIAMSETLCCKRILMPDFATNGPHEHLVIWWGGLNGRVYGSRSLNSSPPITAEQLTRTHVKTILATLYSVISPSGTQLSYRRTISELIATYASAIRP